MDLAPARGATTPQKCSGTPRGCQVLAIRQQFFIDLKHTQTYQDGSDIAQRLDNEFVRVRVSNGDTKKYG